MLRKNAIFSEVVPTFYDFRTTPLWCVWSHQTPPPPPPPNVDPGSSLGTSLILASRRERFWGSFGDLNGRPHRSYHISISHILFESPYSPVVKWARFVSTGVSHWAATTLTLISAGSWTLAQRSRRKHREHLTQGKINQRVEQWVGINSAVEYILYHNTSDQQRHAWWGKQDY